MSENKRFLMSLTLACLGLLMILAGMLRGETLVVLNKAINICMECIGIG